MNLSSIPDVHPDPWLDLMRGYVAETVHALAEGGLRVRASWLDPRDPRDATVLYDDDGVRTATAPVRALVWDEETGWRDGGYVAGAPGVRTELGGARQLGGGVLVTGAELAARVRGRAGVPPTVYRSRHDLRDGLDDALRTY